MAASLYPPCARRSFFFEQGIEDILYAVGVVPGKLPQAIGLAERGAKIHLLLDQIPTAHEIDRLQLSASVVLPTLIEIDSDGHRAGLAPDSEQLLPLAEAIEGSPHLRFAGE